MSRYWLVSVATVVAGTLLFRHAFANAADGLEAVAYGVGNYDPCNQKDLWDYPRTVAKEFDRSMEAIDYSSVNYLDSAVDSRDFTDASKASWGTDTVDPNGADSAEVVLFAGHGSRTCNDVAGLYYSTIIMGDDNDQYPGEVCGVSTRSHMLFGQGGNHETQLLFLFACQTNQYCVATHQGYNTLGSLTNSSQPFRGLFGFHGIMYHGPGNGDDIRNYTDSARFDGLGDNWLDRFYKKNAYLSGHNQCPTVTIWGDSPSLINQQYNNGGFKDIKPMAGPAEHVLFFYLSNCDPSSGEELP